MPSKDSKSPGSKADLLKDLKSLKNTLNEDDDNVPLLLGDEDDDIPVLADEEVPILGEDTEDDIPILDTPAESHDRAADKASLEAALRQLESMELAPKSRKSTPAAPASANVTSSPQNLEEQIRANPAPPIISHEELTKVRENPFLNPKQKAQLEMTRRLQEEAKKTAMITALNKKKPVVPPSASQNTSEGAIEFTDNPFLKASAATSTSTQAGNSPAHKSLPPDSEENGAADILKELGETLDIDAELANIDTELGSLGEIILENDKTKPPTNPVNKKLPQKQIDLMIDEIVEEYLVVLEAALRKKLKEKLPDLLK